MKGGTVKPLRSSARVPSFGVKELALDLWLVPRSKKESRVDGLLQRREIFGKASPIVLTNTARALSRAVTELRNVHSPCGVSLSVVRYRLRDICGVSAYVNDHAGLVGFAGPSGCSSNAVASSRGWDSCVRGYF